MYLRPAVLSRMLGFDAPGILLYTASGLSTFFYAALCRCTVIYLSEVQQNQMHGKDVSWLVELVKESCCIGKPTVANKESFSFLVQALLTGQVSKPCLW